MTACSYVQTEEALNWAMHVPSLAVAQRCMHIARALAPQISPSLVHVLLSALLQCYLHPSVTSFDFTSQLLLALLELLRNSQPAEVKMYPQLFWGCLALLQTVHVPVFALVMTVLDALLSRLQLWNLPCQQIMQAGACTPHVDTALPTGMLTSHVLLGLIQAVQIAKSCTPSPKMYTDNSIV